jgi:AcrR family transcriptional regulator
MSRRKKQLLRGALQYLNRHGIANASLRPMAAQLGTSPRMLMFHFRSKEGLLQDVLGELTSRLQVSLKAKVSSRMRSRGIPPLKRFWQWAIDRKNLPYLRLLYEAEIVAIQNPKEYGRSLKEASKSWQAIVYEALSPAWRSDAMASLCIAVFDGLMIELMISGDSRRLTRALDLFLSLASAAPRDGRQTRKLK